jgi:hypothetical protein
MWIGPAEPSVAFQKLQLNRRNLSDDHDRAISGNKSVSREWHVDTNV